MYVFSLGEIGYLTTRFSCRKKYQNEERKKEEHQEKRKKKVLNQLIKTLNICLACKSYLMSFLVKRSQKITQVLQKVSKGHRQLEWNESQLKDLKPSLRNPNMSLNV